MKENTYNYDEKKIVAVVSSKIVPEVALNVIGHLSVALGAYADSSIMGKKELIDKSGVKHMGISKYPFICTKVKPGKLRKVIEEVRDRHPNVKLHEFTRDMLDTAHDDELCKSIEEKEEEEIEYLGALLYGDSIEIGLLTGKFTLWRIE